MCGIFGFALRGDFLLKDPRCFLLAGTRSLRHRGPDGEGFYIFRPSGESSVLVAEESSDNTVRFLRSNDPWFSNEWPKPPWQVAFGHRRLAILDLTPRGHQPQHDPSGRFWIVHNGEIYNHLELRPALEKRGWRFQGTSDTETILAAWSIHGSECLMLFNGMWSLAIWDSKERTLWCSRDRLGVKPFYYSIVNGSFFFASEPKALLESGVVAPHVDEVSLFEFLSMSRVNHSERTFFDGITSLPPGTVMSWNEDMRIHCTSFWNPEYSGREWTPEAAVQELGEVLQSSVAYRLLSDVPLGSCLSGGIDSSTIVSIAAEEIRVRGMDSKLTQHTVSAIYGVESRHDESSYIQQVVNRYPSLQCHYVRPSSGALFHALEKLAYHQDEPFPSASIFAQWEVFREAKRVGVKVMLDGQGADELFAGYDTFYIPYILGLFGSGRISRGLRECLAALHGKRRPLSVLTKEFLVEFFPKLSLNAAYFAGAKPHSWLSDEFINRHVAGVKSGIPSGTDEPDIFRRFTYANVRSTNLPQLLRFEDRNSMAHSVEARVPFLDYRLVEMGLQMSSSLKIQDGLRKVALRRVSAEKIPEAIRCRTDKIGFSTDEDVWMRELGKEILNIFRAEDDLGLCIQNKKLIEGFSDFLGTRRPYLPFFWRVLSVITWKRAFGVSFSS